MISDRSEWGRALAVLAGLGLLVLCVSLPAQEQTAPKFKFDPDWPKPLPNKWKMGGVTGLAVLRRWDIYKLCAQVGGKRQIPIANKCKLFYAVDGSFQDAFIRSCLRLNNVSHQHLMPGRG